MDPLTLSLLFSGGSMLGGLFGGAGRDQFDDFYRRLMALSGTNAINRDANQLLKMIMSSPAFGQAQRGVWSSSAGLENKLGAALAARGLTTSGIGSVAMPLARSAAGFKLGELNANAANTSFDLAKQLAAMRVGALGGAPGIPNIGGGLFGAGLSGLGDVFREWMKRQAKPKGVVNMGEPSEGGNWG